MQGNDRKMQGKAVLGVPILLNLIFMRFLSLLKDFSKGFLFMKALFKGSLSCFVRGFFKERIGIVLKVVSVFLKRLSRLQAEPFQQENLWFAVILSGISQCVSCTETSQQRKAAIVCHAIDLITLLRAPGCLF